MTSRTTRTNRGTRARTYRAGGTRRSPERLRSSVSDRAHRARALGRALLLLDSALGRHLLRLLGIEILMDQGLARLCRHPCFLLFTAHLEQEAARDRGPL